MSSNSGLEDSDSRSNRIVCAKLYEGGLLHSYQILRSIVHNPFIGKSPEFELDINLITKHAEVAFKRHMAFTLTAIALSFLGLIFNGFYLSSSLGSLLGHSNSTHAVLLFILSWIFSVSAICIIFGKPIFDRKIAFENFSKESYKPDYKPSSELFENHYLDRFCKWLVEHNSKYDQEKTDKQNVIVFGSYFPFIGSGERVQNWNFVTAKLQNNGNETEANSNVLSETLQNNHNHKKNQKDLSIDDLYKTVCAEVKNKELPVTSEYMLYADGKELSKNECQFLLENNSKPLSHLDINQHRKNTKDTFKDYRVYLLFRYHDKVRSTLLSTFLRFSTAGKDFFVECSSYILTPINENIYNIDKLPRNNFFAIKTALIITVLVAFYTLISALPSFVPILLFIFASFPIIYFMYHKVKKYKNIINKIKGKSTYNPGVLKTFRESIASPNYKSYFSAQDITMIEGSIEKSIINSTAVLFDEYGYESSFLTKQVFTFVNNGIMQSGGTITNSNVASGERSIVKQVTEVAQSKAQEFQQKIGISKEAQI